jgi:hypothetical protein
VTGRRVVAIGYDDEIEDVRDKGSVMAVAHFFFNFVKCAY